MARVARQARWGADARAIKKSELYGSLCAALRTRSSNRGSHADGRHPHQTDQIWNAFWSGGASNPLSVIEQITYLLFIKRFDELHTPEEKKAQTLGIAIERRIFLEGNDDKGRPYADQFVMP